MTFKQIREGKFSKIIASYLAIQMLIQFTGGNQLFALTSGPSQPEFNSFTPIGTSDMVDLSSGDFSYNIPMMDIGGYPINLAYQSGITMDQEASWVGLGWNLNVGQINRQVRGLPDDFKGDEMTYENNTKTNVTVGTTFDLNAQLYGSEVLGLGAGLGISVENNNYEGMSAKFTYNAALSIGDNVSVGVDLSSSATEGVSVSPKVNFSAKNLSKKSQFINAFSGSIGIGYNSRQGLTNFNTQLSNSMLSSGTYGLMGSGYGEISFVTKTFTPQKRSAYNNLGLTFAFSAGGTAWGVDFELGLSAYGNFQSLSSGEEHKKEKAYGYDFTELGTKHDILDFNRENDRTLSKNIRVLPTVNYTYDIYNIKGQGVAGMFRPFRGQVGYVFDKYVRDRGYSGSLGAELEAGGLGHLGVDYKQTRSKSYTGLWSTIATSYFNASTNNEIDYERVYYKQVGDLRVDDEANLYESQLGGESPIAIAIKNPNPLVTNTGFNNYAANIFDKKEVAADGTVSTSEIQFNSKIKRTHREKRNQSIQKIDAKELTALGFGSLVNPNAKDHHTAAIKVLKPEGATYIYSETVYNTEKHEVTFAVDGNGNCATGLVNYNGGNENSSSNTSGNDHYFNKVVTPEYAHTYLLSGVLSSDYVDLTGDGLTKDDLGAYTKFNYVTKNPEYQWRVPFQKNMASYNAGFNSNTVDEKGSYLYGKKELKYIESIETKTHVAVFDISERNDGHGVDSDNGSLLHANTSSKMFKLDKIYLFARPEYEKLTEGTTWANVNEQDRARAAVKIAHFEYDYSLCKNIPNNDHINPTSNTNTLANQYGKLTLKNLYFTYRGSNMGKYTPYSFNYDGNINPDYELKGYDVWGNFKPSVDDPNLLNITRDADNNITDVNYTTPTSGYCNTQDPTTAPEFAFVQQQDKQLQGVYSAAWTISSIELPSGGKLELEFESDDYQNVQDRKAMQMMKVVGVSNTSSTTITNNLFTPNSYGSSSNEAKYIVIETNEDFQGNTIKFKEDYLGDNLYKPIYFRFLMNMTKDAASSSNSREYDYVTGYFKIDQAVNFKTSTQNGKYYVHIPMEWSDMEGGVNGNKSINPLSKAGWYFGRSYMNRIVYGLEHDPNDQDIESIARAIVGSLASIIEIFTGPNGKLRNIHHCAKKFAPQKSWIRLQHPDDKLGGGIRVKKLVLNDQWDKMLDLDASSNPEIIDRYQMKYGQEYLYNLVKEDGSSAGSSGVATFEPNMSKENPFVEPFYDSGERLTAPAEMNYVEKPLGVSFYPSPTVTYSRVAVKNLARERTENSEILTVKKHATGIVVNKFFTSKDFPTKADHTNLPVNYASNESNMLENLLAGFLGAEINTKTELSLSQGFVVQTNDMNGKNKMTEVFNENNEFISSVAYKYSTKPDDETTLYNQLPIINPDGTVSSDKVIGRHYDVVTDFRESFSSTKVFGVQGNLAFFVVGIIPVIIPTGFPERSKNKRILHTTTTTKVIHTSGILVETEAVDLNSRVATKNLAWDSESGQVLLTEITNDFDDRYYSFNYPAHWGYKQMGLATNNLGIEGTFATATGDFFKVPNPIGSGDANVLTLGDELLIDGVSDRLWVIDVNTNGHVRLMNRSGNIVTNVNEAKFKVIRSGFRNQQTASMASITTQVNPLDANNDGTLDPITSLDHWENLKVVNASAIEYTDLWNTQCELRLPKPINAVYTNNDGSISEIEAIGYNPYLYNVKGTWKAVTSYAYLTGRNDGSQGFNPRSEGFFNMFNPYYEYDSAQGKWRHIVNATNEEEQKRWTFASKVTKYSPYGAEVENKDALGRYSAAQYGYSYTLPVAVGSNMMYKELGFDGFEDYDYGILGETSSEELNPHFGYQDVAVSDNNVNRTEEESHSGRYSLRVEPQSLAKKSYKIEACDIYQVSDNGPNATIDYYDACVAQGESITLNVLTNDDFGAAGASSSPITITSTLSPSDQYATMNVVNTGDPANPYAIKYIVHKIPHIASFTYEICDATGECDTATVVVNVCTNSN